MITDAEVEAFQRDGAVVVRGALTDWVDVMAAGIARNMADPGPYAARKLKKKKKAMLRAFDRLDGDPNEGGATRHGIVTGYRQDALKCARFLAVHGPSKGAKVAEWAEVPVATKIMADDHYGWFKRVERGVYGLTPNGIEGLKTFKDAITDL